MIGKTISHYKITAKLGEGGMGVVYKAEDTKLERTVALKFLSLTSIGEEEKRRFKREAKAAASLNHPNIATIFAIDEEDSQLFIAMEFIEGQSLADLIHSPPSASSGQTLEGGQGGVTDSRPLTIPDAIDYATQTAAGLQAAHEKGITHRDIKSANLMVTDKGVVKIMDFGLAKLANRSKLTQLGTTLGTAAYMSPEQARGEETDNRADIWSLGVVLYEMISGQLPFKGDYEQAVIYSILNEEPEPLTALRSGLPIALDGIIAKALAKDPTTRYQHVDELPADLKAMETTPSRVSRIRTTATAQVEHPSFSKRWKPMVPWMLALVLAVLFGLARWGAWRERGPTSQPVRRSTIDLPSGQWLGTEYMRSNVALSPDGTRLVYVAVRDGYSQLYLRQFDQFEAHPIPETEGSRDPFFSPDGEWVAFLTSRKLKKVSLSSGTVVTLCDVLPVSSGGGWASDNTIYFNHRPIGGLVRVSADGGTPKPVTTPDSTKGELGHTHPEVLPGGKAILFTIAESEGYQDMLPAVLSFETGAWHRLTERGSSPHYLSTGHLVYVQAGALLAAPFDLDRLQVTGSPIRILEEVMTGNRGAAAFSVSANGSIAYAPDSGTESAYTLVWVDRKGQARPLPLPPRSYSDPRLSPKGTRLAIQIADFQTGNFDVWLGGLEPPLSRFTFNANYDGHPIWTTDGKRVIFSSVRAGQAPNLFWKPADGTGVEEPLNMMENERLNTVGNAQLGTSLSPDGRVLAFIDQDSETGLDIWLVNMKGQRNPHPWLTTEFTETAVFSPTGRWIAYQSDESGRFEIYVRSFPGPGPTHRVSTAGGTEPVWSRDGSELFYRKGNAMMVVSVDTGRAFTAGRPVVLFKGSYLTGLTRANYDVSPDGQRFLMIQGGEPSTQIKVVWNWSEELKRLVPTEK